MLNSSSSFGCISLGWPLYLLIGYINAILYLSPMIAVVWIGIIWWKGANRSIDGSIDRQKTRDAIAFLVNGSLFVVLGSSMLLLDLLLLIPDFPSGLAPAVGILLFFLVLIGYIILINILSKRWMKEIDRE